MKNDEQKRNASGASRLSVGLDNFLGGFMKPNEPQPPFKQRHCHSDEKLLCNRCHEPITPGSYYWHEMSDDGYVSGGLMHHLSCKVSNVELTGDALLRRPAGA